MEEEWGAEEWLLHVMMCPVPEIGWEAVLEEGGGVQLEVLDLVGACINRSEIARSCCVSKIDAPVSICPCRSVSGAAFRVTACPDECWPMPCRKSRENGVYSRGSTRWSGKMSGVVDGSYSCVTVRVNGRSFAGWCEMCANRCCYT